MREREGEKAGDETAGVKKSVRPKYILCVDACRLL